MIFRGRNVSKSLFRSAISRALVFAAVTGAMPTVTQAAYDNGRLKYDNQCITIDGKDMVIFSGAFHYFRCPRELWADRFRTLKAAGFNTLETYAAWNWHEQQEPTGPDDYSKLDMTELHDWLAMAADQFGFQIILRPGPYICAEWDGGGYPQWLLNKRPADYKRREWYRSDDPTYLAWCKHWYTAVAKVAVPFQLTHRPAGKAGIILWQIENEYDYSDQPTDMKKNQLLFLAHTSRDLGIDVPLTTCVTNNAAFHKDDYLRANVVQSDNTYPGFDVGAMERDTRIGEQQPEKFRMISELQGGWFAQVGGKLSEQQGYDQTQLNHVTMFAWEHGFTVTNYYMGFGGTNFGDWGSQGLTTTYDYDAPVRECGGVTARYFAAKALGEFIADHGAQLARSIEARISGDVKEENVHWSLRQSPDGSRFLFVRSDHKGRGQTGMLAAGAGDSKIECHYELGSFGAKVLYLPPKSSSDTDGGVWYPKPQREPKRPTDLPAPIVFSDVRTMVDSGPATWAAFNPEQTLAQSGIFNRQNVVYHTTVPAGAGNAGQLALVTQLAGKDWIGVEVNGTILKSVEGRINLPKTDGEETVTVVYENAGRPNFGNTLEQPNGLLHPQVVALTGQPTAITHPWKEHHLDGKPKAELSADFDDSSWSTADINVEDGDLQPGKSAVYRTTIDLSAADVKDGKILTLGRVDDDGTVYINGKKAGESHDWAQAQHFNITPHLREGKNTIAVYIVNREGAGGLSKGASLEPLGTPVPTKWEMSQQLAGVAGKWFDTGFDDSAWKTLKVGEPITDHKQSESLLSWYRMKFELPTPTEHEWIPWRLNLTAVGNGFIYLNGHQIGRWWEVGPQNDFFLPECWLNFGPGKSNVITLELRPTTSPASIKTAEVRPYENLAETR